MEKIASHEAKTQLPEILRRVEEGVSFTITSHGKPVADLVPSRATEQSRKATAINNILRGVKHRVSDELLAELKAEGRK